MTPEYVAEVTRFFFKATLGFMYLDLGPDRAMDPTYDGIRRVVLGDSYRGFLTLANNAKPHGSVTLSYWPLEIDDHRAIVVQLDVFGVQMETELLGPYSFEVRLQSREFTAIEF